VLALLVFQVGQEEFVLRRTGIASISMTVGLSQHPYEYRPQRFSSQSIKSSANVRVFGLPHNSPMRSARSKSGSIRTWSSSARGAGPRA
jgi:hypothetical protein